MKKNDDSIHLVLSRLDLWGAGPEAEMGHVLMWAELIMTFGAIALDGLFNRAELKSPISATPLLQYNVLFPIYKASLRLPQAYRLAPASSLVRTVPP